MIKGFYGKIDILTCEKGCIIFPGDSTQILRKVTPVRGPVIERKRWGDVSNIPWILMKGLDLTIDGEQWSDIKKLMSLFTW